MNDKQAKLLKAMDDIIKAYSTIIELAGESDIINDAICVKYPYQSSLDEELWDAIGWKNAVSKELNK